MPVRLSHLARDKRTCTVAVGDESVTVVYRPSAITPELEDQLREYAADQRGGAALVALLAQCLVEWDVLDDTGTPLQPTTENLRRLPIAFLGQVVQALMEDLRPNPPRGGSFADGS